MLRQSPGALPYIFESLFIPFTRLISLYSIFLPVFLSGGGGQLRVEVSDSNLIAPDPDDQLLAMNDALNKLAIENPTEAKLVKLRYFVGMTNDETADGLGISPRTAKYYWIHARAWLLREINSNAG